MKVKHAISTLPVTKKSSFNAQNCHAKQQGDPQKMITILKTLDKNFLVNESKKDETLGSINVSVTEKPTEKVKKVRKMSLEKKNTEEVKIGYFQSQQEFIEVYNKDPIFRHKVNMMIKESELKIKKNPELKALKGSDEGEKGKTLRRRKSENNIQMVVHSEELIHAMMNAVVCNQASYGIRS